MRRRDPPRPSTRRPWRRRESNPSTDPSIVFRKLQRRQLADVEDCRIAWERAGDPLALCVAVTKCGAPEWLADALLVLLTDGPGGARLLRACWKSRARDAIDAVRAAEVAGARTHPELPQTWERAYWFAEKFVDEAGYNDVPKVGLDAMKMSYRRVCRGLVNDGRYFAAPGFGKRLQLARRRIIGLMEAQVARQRQSSRK